MIWVNKRKFGSLTLCVLLDFFKHVHIDRIKMDFSYHSLPNSDVFLYLKIIFALTNSVDPDEIHLFVALHLGLHCLSECSFRSQLFNIHEQVSTVHSARQKGKQKCSFWQDRLHLLD